MTQLRIFSLMLSATLVLSGPSARGQMEFDDGLDSLLQIRVSTASKYDQDARDVAASISVITDEDFERFGFQTLADALGSLPGFYLSNDRTYSYLGVRGFGRASDFNNRVLFLLNGHTMNDNVWGGGFVGSEFPVALTAIERVEVVRGPGSVIYGGGAMFAVVNVITKPGNALDGLHLLAEAGSYGRQNWSFVLGKKYDDGFEFTLSGRWENTRGQDFYFADYDDLGTNNGLAQYCDIDSSLGFFGAIRYGEFAVQSYFSTRTKRIPTGQYGTTFNSEFTAVTDSRWLGELTYDPQISKDVRLSLRGFYDGYYYRGRWMFDEPSFDFSHGTWFGGEARAMWDIDIANRLTAGFETTKNPRSDSQTLSGDVTVFDRNEPFTVISFYAQHEFQPWETFSVTLGLRHDRYSLGGNSTTPRAALLVAPFSNSTLKLMYGEAYRSPNFSEQFYIDPNSHWIDNPHLQPERIRTIEFAWEQHFGKTLSGTISLYTNRISNLIEQVFIESDSTYQYQNAGSANAHGVETELSAKTLSGHRAFLSYSYAYSYDLTTGTWFTNSPIHTVKTGFIVPFLNVLYGSLDLLYESPRRTVRDGETKSYVLTNVRIGTMLLFDHLRFGVSVKNAFNTRYSNPGGYDHRQEEIHQNGRSVHVQMEFSL